MKDKQTLVFISAEDDFCKTIPVVTTEMEISLKVLSAAKVVFLSGRQGKKRYEFLFLA